MTSNGSLRPATRLERVWARVRRVLWWRQMRCEVVFADPERGTIAMRGLTWSWKRWRWV